MTIILTFGVIFLFTIIYKVHEILKFSELSVQEKRWLTLVLGILALPILKLLDKILMSIGFSEDLVFYGSILVVAAVLGGMKLVLDRKMDKSLHIDHNA